MDLNEIYNKIEFNGESVFGTIDYDAILQMNYYGT